MSFSHTGLNSTGGMNGEDRHEAIDLFIATVTSANMDMMDRDQKYVWIRTDMLFSVFEAFCMQ